MLQGCIFKRFYPGQFNPYWDVEDTIAGGSCWQRAFATEDEYLVESICKGNGVSFDWISVDSSEETPPTLVTQECFKDFLSYIFLNNAILLSRQIASISPSGINFSIFKNGSTQQGV